MENYCIIHFFDLPLPTETTKQSKVMRTLTKKQAYHYILTFDNQTLIYWYNNVMCEPFGDYSEQVIRDNDEQGENDLKDCLSLETLLAVGKNPKTNYAEDSLYFVLTGGEKPYILSFDTFEQFMEKLPEEDRDGMLEYLLEYPENLESLEDIAKQGIK